MSRPSSTLKENNPGFGRLAQVPDALENGRIENWTTKSILYLTIFEGIWNLCQADKPGIVSFRVLEDLFILLSMKNHKVWHATRHD